MASDSLAVVLHGVNDVRLQEVAPPRPAAGQVLLAMDTVSICGTDVSFLTKGHVGDYVINKPMIMGHEPSGVVVELGEGVQNLCVGDRVAVEPGVPCGTCERCLAGNYNLCPRSVCCATPPHDGAMRRLYAHAANFCHRLPAGVSLEEGALMEPLSVCVHACRRAGVSPGDRVLICGAGPIGLMSVMVARAMGATEFVATDIYDDRLELARKLGVQHVLNVSGEKSAEQLTDSVIRLLGGRRADRTIECSGAELSLQLSILATRSCGVVSMVGLGADRATVPLVDAALREVDLHGCRSYPGCYPAAIALVASGRVNLQPLITHRFPLKKALQALETVRLRRGGAVKVLVKCNE